MSTIIGVLITVGLGSWLAFLWQERSARQTRYFDASKTQYDMMRNAARDLAKLIGKRIYSAQRLCLVSKSHPSFDEAREQFRESIVEWNLGHLQVDLDIRTLFAHSRVTEFENLQVSLVEISRIVSKRLEKTDTDSRPDHDLFNRLSQLRGRYFSFLQGMINESDNVFRQMHFGVLLSYDRQDINSYSTLDLVKALFTGPNNESSVLRSPTDFGMPVRRSDAWLRINKH